MERGKMKLEELNPGESGVELVCKVISCRERTISVKGVEKKIYQGTLADESGALIFTAWKDFELHEGDVISIKNAYTKKWRDQLQVNLGDKTVVEAVEMEITPKIVVQKIKDLRGGMSNVCVRARILSVAEREVVVKGVSKTIWSGALGDETGKIQFTAWADLGLAQGSVVKIVNAYVRSRKGLSQLNLSQSTKVEVLDDTLIPPSAIKDREISIAQLLQRGGYGIVVKGVLLEIRKGSGLIHRCSVCNRAGKKGSCVVHGSVETTPDLRIKGVLDDSTGTVDVILNRKLTERLLGKTLDQVGDRAMEEIGKLLVNPVEVHGYTLKDEFGYRLIGTSADIPEVSIAEEARKILEELR